MQGSWWRQQKDMDPEQQAVVNLDPIGRYLVLGPPGSGKTNLLLLRTQWLSLSGKHNVLFLTLGRSLSEFIRTGVSVKKIINPEQIKTYQMWAKQMMADNAPYLLKDLPQEYEASRLYLAEKLDDVTRQLPNNYYDAIAVDEIQDLSEQELAVLSRLSPRLMVAGDARQSIYGQGGVAAAQKLGFEVRELHFHYRIGRSICELADKVYAPDEGHPPLTQRCMYDEKSLPSSTESIVVTSVAEQCVRLVENIRTQLKAYPGEAISVLTPTFKHGILDQLKSALEGSEFAGLVEYHGENGRSFPDSKLIYVLTCHSAKGTEFRAVHLVGTERMAHGPLGRRSLIFTAITRAKTSFKAYCSGGLPPSLATGFAQETVPELHSLFG